MGSFLSIFFLEVGEWENVSDSKFLGNETS